MWSSICNAIRTVYHGGSGGGSGGDVVGKVTAIIDKYASERKEFPLEGFFFAVDAAVTFFSCYRSMRS